MARFPGTLHELEKGNRVTKTYFARRAACCHWNFNRVSDELIHVYRNPVSHWRTYCIPFLRPARYVETSKNIDTAMCCSLQYQFGRVGLRAKGFKSRRDSWAIPTSRFRPFITSRTEIPRVMERSKRNTRLLVPVSRTMSHTAWEFPLFLIYFFSSLLELGLEI